MTVTDHGLTVTEVPRTKVERKPWEPRRERMAVLLREGRERVARGWTQGAYSRETADGTCFCAVGAVPMGTGQHKEAVEILAQILDPTRDPYGPGWQDCPDAGPVVGDWNDSDGRTQAEVVALFDVAVWATENDRDPVEASLEVGVRDALPVAALQ